MIKERAVSHAAKALVELAELQVCTGSAATIRGVQTAERAYAINPGRVTLRLEEGRFEIRLAEAGFADPIRIILGVNAILNNLAVGAAKPKTAIVELQLARGIDQAGIHCGSGAEELDLLL